MHPNEVSVTIAAFDRTSFEVDFSKRLPKHLHQSNLVEVLTAFTLRFPVIANMVNITEKIKE